MIGSVLGRYRLVEQLGKGWMATVYKAYQPSLERYVAIKVLHPLVADEEEFVGRFHQEAKAVALLRHPHIVQIHDFGVKGDLYYMVMEFIEGQTLKERLAELKKGGQTMTLGEARHITEQMASALDYAHRRGMIHRDIKPANIMLTPEGEVILTDFGLARMVEGIRYTQTGVVGTPDYMSPEQGQGMELDGRTDIYSLGVVLYEMLTGRTPFVADTPVAVVVMHIQAPLPSPRMINPAISRGVEQVILKALAKKPEARYQRASDMAQALAQACEAQPAQVGRTCPRCRTLNPLGNDRCWRCGTALAPERYQPPERSKLWMVVAAFGALLLVAVVVAAVVLLGTLAITVTVTPTEGVPLVVIATFTSSPTPTRRTPTATFTAIPQPIATATPKPTPTSTLRPSPTPTLRPTVKPSPQPVPTVSYENKIVFRSDRDGGESFYIMNLDGSEQRKLDDESVYEKAKAGEMEKGFPGATRKLIVRHEFNNWDIYLADDEGRELRITSDHADDYDPAWSLDGGQIAFVSHRGGQADIWLLTDTSGRGDFIGAKDEHLTENQGDNRHPTWSLDGGQIAFWSDRDGERKQIWVMGADGSNQHNISNNAYNDWNPVWIKWLPQE